MGERCECTVGGALEFLVVAAAYRLLRENVGGTGRVFLAAARVYQSSYELGARQPVALAVIPGGRT